MPITHLYFESGDRKDEIKSYSLGFDQDSNERSGKPVGKPMLTHVTLVIERDNEEDVSFYVEWQTKPTDFKDGKICFYDGNQLKRSISLTGAFLVSYDQETSIPGTVLETLVISPQNITVEGVEFSREDK